MISESQRLEQQISHLESRLDQFPSGNLICCHYQNRCKWYHSDGHHKTYIPKRDRRLAQQLALKKYLTLQLEDLLAEKKAIQSYLKYHRLSPGKPELLLSQDPEYRSLLSDLFIPGSVELANWADAPFCQNDSHPEQLVHKSVSGHKLRSKSESVIDMFLYMNKIPFRYECLLQLGDITLFPDFTIRHPETGNVYYWEHFGLMDRTDYSQKAFSKLQLYTTHGIIPSIRLITTYETKDHPLNADLVQKIIRYYFL